MLFKPLHRESVLIPWLLLILSVAVWSEMDLFAPSLPDAMKAFGTTEQVIQWTFSFNFFGFFLASLFCGALSDALGRRIVLLSGTALFTLGSALSVWSPSIEIFLAGRLIQGLGVAGPAVVTMAILGDIYKGKAYMRWLSAMNAITTLTMALAPIVGAYLNQHFGWRSNFMAILVLALIGLVLNAWLVPETRAAELRHAFKPKMLISNYTKLLRSKNFVYPMIGLCSLVIPYFVFVGVAPLLYLNDIGMPMSQYVWFQASVVAVFSLLSLVVSYWTDSLDMDRLNRISIWFLFFTAIALVLVGLLMVDNPWLLTGLMCCAAAGMVVPCLVLYAKAISRFPELQASSNALFQSVRMLMLSIGSALAGAVYNGTYAPIGMISGFYVLLGFLLVFPILREKTNAEDLSRLANAGH